MSNHTPGPWYVNAEQVFGKAYLIAQINENCPDWQANRDLIEAAPTMLAALRTLIAWDDACEHNPYRLFEAMKEVRAAYAKATNPQGV